MNARKLPVLGTAVKGWRLVAQDWWILLRIILLPLAVLIALDVYLDALWWGRFHSLSGVTPQYVDNALSNLLVLDQLLALFLGGLMMALWQRVRVAGRPGPSYFGLLAAAPNVAALTMLWCSLLLITVGVIWVFDALMWEMVKDPLERLLVVRFQLADSPVLYGVLDDLVLQGVPLIATMHIAGRLSLMLWARPAGGAGALDRAWAAGSGNGWRLAAAVFLALLPITTLSSVLEASGIASGTLYYYLSFDVAYLLQLIVAVAVIATAHDTLMENDGPSEASDRTARTGATTAGS